jgi:hypothetical protein
LGKRPSPESERSLHRLAADRRPETSAKAGLAVVASLLFRVGLNLAGWHQQAWSEVAQPVQLDWVKLDWVKLDWVKLDWVKLDWVKLDWVKLD